jgi:hypothetical protein
MMLKHKTPQEFRPLIGNRRTELFAWILAIITLLGSWFSPVLLGIGHLFTVFLVVFFVLSAVLISFGNWLERHTTLKLADTGIEYKNGIRLVRVNWKDIKEVRVYPSGKGSKVVVYSGHEYFSFQTLTEVSTGSKVKIRYGFDKGEEILEMILQRSNLQDVGKHHTEQYDYYLSE